MNLLLDPPTNPMANCNFLFCPPESVPAFELIFASKSQSRNSCSTSSSPLELCDHFTALQTRRVCTHDSSENSTFFCGTIPIVPCGGRGTPPSKVTDPFVGLIRPPNIERAVDFPALFRCFRIEQQATLRFIHSPIRSKKNKYTRFRDIKRQVRYSGDDRLRVEQGSPECFLKVPHGDSDVVRYCHIVDPPSPPKQPRSRGRIGGIIQPSFE